MVKHTNHAGQIMFIGMICQTRFGNHMIASMHVHDWKPDEKKRKDNKQTLVNLSSAHCH